MYFFLNVCIKMIPSIQGRVWHRVRGHHLDVGVLCGVCCALRHAVAF